MQLTPAAAIRALKRAIYKPRAKSRRSAKRIVNEFHKLYYYDMERTWKNTFWLNVPVAKCPLDLWIYQEIIYETKPDFIIETGTAYGGSALFMTPPICDLINRGQIITIDINEQIGRPKHEEIKYLIGSSTNAKTVEEVRTIIPPQARVMVILDSDHSIGHVLDEISCYSPMVTNGCYLIVEDTNANGHPVLPLYGNGPMEAVQQFVKRQRDFVVDCQREKFFMTFNPKGYLRRVA